MSDWNSKRPLSDKQLEEIIANWANSDDEVESDENEDLENIDINNIPIIFEDDNNEEAIELMENDENNETLAKKEKTNEYLLYKENFKDLLWKNKNLVLNEDLLSFRGKSSIPTHIQELSTPYSFFRYFFDDELVQKIANESNLYSVQKNPAKATNIDTDDIKNFLGILIYMSVINLPSARHYWSTNIGITQIKETMSQHTFDNIRATIHFADNSTIKSKDDPQADRLHKLRPVINYLNSKFESIPFEQFLCVDEQMCSTKARHYLKQYMPLKPHKWGFKLFVLCGVSGFAYKFEIYTGTENRNRLDTEPDLGASANVVVRLCRNIPTNEFYRIYFDNYYSSIPLVSYLATRGIYSLGTIRRNRIPNCKLPSEKEMKKVQRGTSYEYVADANGVDISTVVWKDNKIVTLVSSFVGQLPLQEVNRFDKKLNEKVKIACPNLVKEYNRHMGGVDFLDSLIGKNKIKLRTKKWYMRIFYHLLDLTLINSWILYRKNCKEKTITLVQFKIEVADCLCRANMQNKGIKRGRPSGNNMEQQIQTKKKKGPTSYVPPKDVRTDAVGHWPSYTTERTRCKKPNCKKLTYVKCDKCGLHLCFNKDNNCFREFHE